MLFSHMTSESSSKRSSGRLSFKTGLFAILRELAHLGEFNPFEADNANYSLLTYRICNAVGGLLRPEPASRREYFRPFGKPRL